MMTPDLRARCEELAQDIGAEAADAVSILVRFYHDGYRAGLEEVIRIGMLRSQYYRSTQGQGDMADWVIDHFLKEIRQCAPELKKEPPS